jgi:hypothetical protein
MVVEPVTPLSLAVHVLDAAVAVNTSAPDVLMVVSMEELVTDPPAPVLPWVLTEIGPELKSVAGPIWTSPSSAVMVIGPPDPAGGRVTMGVGATTVAGGSNRYTLAEYPKALPFTALTEALDEPGRTASPAATDAIVATAILRA